MRLPSLVVAVLFLLPACNTPEVGKPDETGEQPQVPTLELAFSLAQDSSIAGEAIGYTAELRSEVGEPIAVEVTLASDLEPALRFDASTLTATLVGSHAVTATAYFPTDYGPDDYTATVSLQVLAGPPAQIDLDLADVSMPAGASLDYAVGLWDAYGNAVDASLATVSADSADLLVRGSFVESTVPGIYTLTATAAGADGDITDDETLVVHAGGPASIDLVLSDTSIEQNETSSASVTVWDAFGNEVEADWTLFVEASQGADPTSVNISGVNLSFQQEGVFTVVAQVTNDETGDVFEDREGPILVDSTGPDLDITDPTRGGWVSGLQGQYAGSAIDDWSGVSSLTINGASTRVAADGSFVGPASYAFGTNLVETIATDGDGNSTQDLRAVLAGNFLTYGTGIGDGIGARINQGGFDTIEGLAYGLLNNIDLNAFIPSPVYSNSSQTCVWGWCFTWYSINLYAYNARYNGTYFDIDPQTGKLHVTAVIYNPAVDWSASGVAAEIGYSMSGTVTADWIQVTTDLTPYISGGEVFVSVSNTVATSSGFNFYFNDTIEDVLDFFGVDVDAMIRDYMETAIEEQITTQIPPMIEDALQDLELGTTLAVLGNNYDLYAEPYSINIDDNGLTLGLQTWFSTQNWLVSAWGGYGTLYAGYRFPGYATTPGMVLSISPDFLNQALYAFWAGGLLDMDMSGADFGINAEDLSLLFPDVTEVNVSTRAFLPPVLLPGTGTEMLDLQLGDFEVTLYGGPAQPGNELIQAYVHVFAGLDVTVTDTAITPSIGTPTIYFDVVAPEGNTLAAAQTESLLETLVPMFLPLITSAISTIPVPAISGFTLVNISAGVSTSGTIDVGGDLVMQ